MAYEMTWGSKTPGILVYMVDLSDSMNENNKFSEVSAAIYNALSALIAPCIDVKEDNTKVYVERFKLFVFGYNQFVEEIFTGGIKDIDEHLEARKTVKKFIDAENEKYKPKGLTHMAMAYKEAAKIIKEELELRGDTRRVPAPMVINITDGYPEEKDTNDEDARRNALKAAENLRNISVEDGNVRIFNIHVDGSSGIKNEIIFPLNRPNEVCKAFMYDASSELENAVLIGNQQVPAKARLMVSNLSNYKLLKQLIVFGSSGGSSNIGRETPIE